MLQVTLRFETWLLFADDDRILLRGSNDTDTDPLQEAC